MRHILIVFSALVIFSSATVAKPWSSISTGLDASTLIWEHGTHTAWSFQTAFGPRIIDNLFLRAKISIPIPFLIVVGNQINLGGEVSYLVKNPECGFAIETSFGGGWTATWPEDIIVILADGETTAPPVEQDFDGADGIRWEALASFGCKFREGVVWLDLGIDHRRMNVRRFVDDIAEESFFLYTGPHIGISADIFFGD